MTDNEYQIYWREQFQAAQRQIAEMTMRQAILVAALKEVEWVLDANYQRGCPHECAWCQGSEKSGHRDGCHRQVALERCKNVADKSGDTVEASPVVELNLRKI